MPWSGHGKTSDLYDELRKRLPALRCEGGEERTYQSRGRSGHLLVDRLWSEGAGSSTGTADGLRNLLCESPQDQSFALIKGVVCGVRVEDVKEPTMREIRYLDKLIDELAKGKAMDKILRKSAD